MSTCRCTRSGGGGALRARRALRRAAAAAATQPASQTVGSRLPGRVCVCARARVRACLSRHPRQSGGGCRAKEKGGGVKRWKTYTRRRSRYDGRLCLAEEEAVERRKIDQTILPPRRDIDQARGEGLPESHSHMAATASLDDDGLRAAELSTLSSIP